MTCKPQLESGWSLETGGEEKKTNLTGLKWHAEKETELAGLKWHATSWCGPELEPHLLNQLCLSWFLAHDNHDKRPRQAACATPSAISLLPSHAPLHSTFSTLDLSTRPTHPTHHTPHPWPSQDSNS